MALANISSLMFMAFFCFFLYYTQAQSTGLFLSLSSAHGKSAMLDIIHGRKMLYSLKEKDTFQSTISGSSERHGYVAASSGNGKSADWELREAPLGPDPLHHNGGSPWNKLRTP